MDQPAAVETPGIEYAYKPSLMGAGWHFRLEPDALVWSAGTMTGRVPYASIRRIRLGFRPGNMQSYRFLAEIWSDRGPKIPVASSSWKSMVEQERLDERYTSFITALHRKIAEAHGTPQLQAGSLPLLYWPGVMIFIAICVGTVWLMVTGMQQAELWGMLFLLGFFLFLIWQLGRFFKRNLPRSYTLDSIPADVLP